jgi:hypothetical protein
MIQAKELRIGNLITDFYFPSLPSIVVEIQSYGFIVTNYNDGLLNVDAEPIPLTHEILLNCGFEKINSYWVNKRNIDCHIVLIDALTRYMVSVTGPFGMVTLKSINSVHQLQNLYYALTGEELIYKP